MLTPRLNPAALEFYRGLGPNLNPAAIVSTRCRDFVAGSTLIRQQGAEAMVYTSHRESSTTSPSQRLSEYNSNEEGVGEAQLLQGLIVTDIATYRSTYRLSVLRAHVNNPCKRFTTSRSVISVCGRPGPEVSTSCTLPESSFFATPPS